MGLARRLLALARQGLREAHAAGCQLPAVTAQYGPSQMSHWTTDGRRWVQMGFRSYQSSQCQLHGMAAPAGISPGVTGDVTTAVTMSEVQPDRIRNLCIIAHIDHGKTTLADQLLKQAWALDALHSGQAGSGGQQQQEEMSLDSGDLERERGITILSKVTSFTYKGHVINLVDTPGHADFGGEVERVLGLVDGAVLVVDASEGPLAQTKFVLGKALARGLAPLVLLNKVDKESATPERCDLVESSLFDLFATLGANDQQLDFPRLYASARQGWASKSLPSQGGGTVNASMEPLLDSILSHVPAPRVRLDQPFTFSVAMVERDPYVGRIVTGRIHSGQLRAGEMVHVLSPHSPGAAAGQPTGTPSAAHKVVRITKRVGMQDVQLDRAIAGDVVSISGVPAAIADTIAAPGVTQALDTGRMDPPTLSMIFAANDSPFASRAGKAVTGRVIGERLMSQAETSVSLTVQQLRGATERYEVCARGEMQLAVLVENMRREGMEVAVSPPAVLTRMDQGVLMEPIEEATAEVDDGVAGQVIELLSLRKGELLDMAPVAGGRQRLVFHVPSRGLIGFKSIFVNLTRGEGLLSRAFIGYDRHRGSFQHVRKGVMISNAEGPATRHALMELQQRGTFFISPGEEVYEGQVVGLHNRDEDLEINPTRTKHLTNVRSTKREVLVPLPPAQVLTLEEAIGFVGGDELIEVTPEAVRVRKVELNSDKRKTAARQAKSRDRSAA